MKPRDRSMGSSRTITLLVSLVLISLSLLLLSQNSQFAPIQNFVYGVTAPVQRTIGDATGQVNSWILTLQQMHTLQQENEQLKADIQRLQTDNARLQDLRAENERLQSMLKFQTEYPELRQLPATVIGYDPAGLSQMLVIDRGARDGLTEGMAVTSPGG